MSVTRFLIVLGIVIFFIGCADVRPYQRAYLNHSEMEAGGDLLEGYETNAQNYREGASGGTGGKTGGGCGCN